MGNGSAILRHRFAKERKAEKLIGICAPCISILRMMSLTSLRSGSGQDIGVTRIQHSHCRTVIKLSARSTQLNLSALVSKYIGPPSS